MARFTKKELELILAMAFIAEAGSPEGDYQGWTTRDYVTLERVIQKANERLPVEAVK